MKTNVLCSLLAAGLVLAGFTLTTRAADAGKGKLVVTGSLVRTNEAPLAGYEIVIKGVLRTYDDGGVGRFWTRTEATGAFRIEIDRSHLTNETSEVTIEGGKPLPGYAEVETRPLVKPGTGEPITIPVSGAADTLDLGKVNLKLRELKK